MDRKGFWAAFWRLAGPYWVSEDRWRGRGLFGLLIALNLAIVWVNVRLNTWNGEFYDSLQNKKLDDFKRLLLEFCGWAFLYIILAVYQLYFTQMLTIRWRRWLTDRYMARWLADAAHYRLSLADFGTDNPDQRLAEDFRTFVSDSLSLFFGLLSSVVTFVSFVLILWGLSGSVELFGITIPGYMVWVALAYSVVGSLVAHQVGKPLIGLNFRQERFEADFRFALVRARENAEGIALYRGEADELKGFRQRFGNLVDNWWAIMKYRKRFTWFASFYGQLAIVFPILVASPRYFSGAIGLGGLTQTSGAFGQVQGALSWLVDAYVQIAGWRAAIARLNGFASAIETARGLGGGLHAVEGAGVDLGDVALAVPRPAAAGSAGAATQPGGAITALPINGAAAAAIATTALLVGNGQRIEPGAHTLIAGPSGSGKSTLFRLLSGIWPFADGHFGRTPVGETLFLPQKPYLPLGTLRTVLAYPEQARGFSDAQLTEALRAVNLPALVARLDETANWSQLLSGGEQQRLAVARALLIAPRWLFLDEATSALDPQAEAALYDLLLARLPGTTLVSIAHRESVARFHRQRLLVEPQGDGPATLRIEPIATV